MDSTIITTRISQLEPIYREFVLSDYIDVKSQLFAEKLNFDEVQAAVFGNGITLYLLAFINKYELIEFFITECKINISQAQEVVALVHSDLPISMVNELSYTKSGLEVSEPKPIKESQRLQILDSLPQAKLLKYLYVKTSLVVKHLLQKSDILTVELLDDCRVLLGDIILGFYKIEDTVPLLQQELGLDAKTAALLGAEVLDFLAPLSDPNWQPPIDSDIETTPETIKDDISSVGQPQSEFITESLPNVATNLPELRTMAADMLEERSPARNTFNAAAAIDEPMYVSTQPAIEKKAPDAPSYTAPLYQPPKPNVDAPLEKPRWG